MRTVCKTEGNRKKKTRRESKLKFRSDNPPKFYKGECFTAMARARQKGLITRQ